MVILVKGKLKRTNGLERAPGFCREDKCTMVSRYHKCAGSGPINSDLFLSLFLCKFARFPCVEKRCPKDSTSRLRPVCDLNISHGYGRGTCNCCTYATAKATTQRQAVTNKRTHTVFCLFVVGFFTDSSRLKLV